MHRLARAQAAAHVVIGGRIGLLPLVVHDAGIRHLARFILASADSAALNVGSITAYIVLVRRGRGATAITTDNRRRLIFPADSEGTWILREHFAEDPEIVHEYSEYVRYGLAAGSRAGREAAVAGFPRQGHPKAKGARTEAADLTAVKIARRGYRRSVILL